MSLSNLIWFSIIYLYLVRTMFKLNQTKIIEFNMNVEKGFHETNGYFNSSTIEIICQN